ncbi:somatostatin-2-like [Candoia aspera]|uniref:somatostatin-2-like n=1 Tax=Candoia aspera TaxID=51853 RepID=UPI002FD7D68D
MQMVARFVAVLLLTWSMRAAALPGEDNFSAHSSRVSEQPKARKALILKMLAGLLNGVDVDRDAAVVSDVENPLEIKLEEEPLMLGQSRHTTERVRKAPCKNFFWKTFTAC